MPDQVRHDEDAQSFVVTKWDRALTRYRAAESALAAAAHTKDEALYDRLGARHDAALKRLLGTKAPHAGALAQKLSLLNAHQAWELTGAERFMPAIEADAHRLS